MFVPTEPGIINLTVTFSYLKKHYAEIRILFVMSLATTDKTHYILTMLHLENLKVNMGHKETYQHISGLQTHIAI